MVLSNVAIVKALQEGAFSIKGIVGTDPSEPPFNTTAVDLRLSAELRIPVEKHPVVIDLTKPNIAAFLEANSEKVKLVKNQPYTLKPQTFVLGNTLETVDFPLGGKRCYSARVEGKSSFARCGMLVHFTAPTIHAGFKGTIALELINLGPHDLLLTSGMYICQLIIEEVEGDPTDAPNQFKGQTSSTGIVENR